MYLGILFIDQFKMLPKAKKNPNQTKKVILWMCLSSFFMGGSSQSHFHTSKCAATFLEDLLVTILTSMQGELE